MNLFAIGVTAASSLVASPPTTKAVEVTDPVPVEATVVGGRPIAVARAPWQVALLSAHASAADDDAYLDQFCAGSLIAADWVLTAAHCMFDERGRALIAADIDVLVGEGVLSESTSAGRLRIDRIVVHPDWDDANSLAADIALINLARSAAVDDVMVTTATVPSTSSGVSWPSRGEELLVAGWGCRSVLANGADCPTGGDGYYADALHAVEVTDLTGPNANDCGLASDFDPATMICAGDLAGGTDACIGDSGGGLVDERSTPIVAGIVSFGEGCAQAGYPGIYTRVSAYADWIEATSGVSPVDITTIAERTTVVPITPARILDTRNGVGTTLPGPVGALDGTGGPVEVVVAGRAGLPTSGLGAVALNVTVVGGVAPAEGGYVTVFPCGERPDASNLNFVTGQTVPNAVIAPVSAEGTVCLYVYGLAHLLVDVSGYLPSGFVPLTPTRVLDTRNGVGARAQRVGELDGSGDSLVLTVAGRGGVPSAGVDAVALNVTVVDGRTNDFGGYVAAHPCGTTPSVSNLNFISGQTVPNSIIAPVASDGTVCLYVYGTAHLLADVSGYMVVGFETVEPARILDTRDGTGAVARRVGSPDGSGPALTLTVVGRGGVPADGVAAVALNVTVVDGAAPDSGGFVTVYPCGDRPNASNLNFVTGQTVPNAVIAPVSADGTVCLYSFGSAHLLADVSGYFTE
jgi:secreted trypsin-like serine protease